jgi:uncharacterized protein (DUF1499 family)
MAKGSGPTRTQLTQDSTLLVAIIIFFFSIITVSAAVIAGIGNRHVWWNSHTAFSILRWAYFSGFLSLMFTAGLIVLCWRRKNTKAMILSGIAFMIAMGINTTAFSWWLKAQSSPPIHDVTTDTLRPPAYVKILELRKDAPNPGYYPGPDNAKLQQQAYPYLQTLLLNISPDQALGKAERLAIRLGWNVVAVNGLEGRLEAVATTFWFGFKDDIVIRILPDKGGSKIDIRSSSRVGRNDLGTNAERIKAFLRAMRESP